MFPMIVKHCFLPNFSKMKKTIPLFFLSVFYLNFSAQDIQHDSLKHSNIQEVIVIGTKDISQKQSKPLSSIDEYLEQSANINMLKRGAYAWEPILNNMPTERTLVTIDGMRIFGACTDKMDPVTSYVEVSNLSRAEISSGQSGSSHGSTIGGSIDLVREKSTFGDEKFRFGLNSGFESVNLQKIFGSSVSYRNTKFYTDLNFMNRDAENYKAGNGEEIRFSQYRKFNISGISGVKIGKNKLLEASVIYDKANDVGYPALPMDVSLAEALITSLKFQYLPKNKFISDWETKIYFNTITHRMDDTKRPSVPIHMDMPGWSKTAGYFSKLQTTLNQHHFNLNLNGFYNQSVAEMTMYPTNPTENLMFMYTWPDVRTFNQGIFLEDHFQLDDFSEFRFSASLSYHSNKVQSDFGLNSLQIFYPEMMAQNNRILKSVSANYSRNQFGFEYGIGVGYGDRAPSVSEGYGFYLFNSSENYDYIGNPNLKNESSLEANAYLSLKKTNFFGKISSSYFHISNYIVGKVNPNFAPMTIGAKGVKLYSALDYATIFNISLDAEIKVLPELKWTSQVVYSRGKDFENVNLPFISPISYLSKILFEKNKFNAEVSVNGNLKNSSYASVYGEKPVSDYVLLNANLGYKFDFGHSKIFTKLGVENLLDRNYTTYADWNRIPRPGRNFFVNINYNF